MRNLSIVAVLLLVGCASGKTHFGNGQFVSADYDHPISKGDALNEYDSRILIQGALDNLKCDGVRPRVVMISNFENQTPE